MFCTPLKHNSFAIEHIVGLLILDVPVMLFLTCSSSYSDRLLDLSVEVVGGHQPGKDLHGDCRNFTPIANYSGD